MYISLHQVIIYQQILYAGSTYHIDKTANFIYQFKSWSGVLRLDSNRCCTSLQLTPCNRTQDYINRVSIAASKLETESKTKQNGTCLFVDNPVKTTSLKFVHICYKPENSPNVKCAPTLWFQLATAVTWRRLSHLEELQRPSACTVRGFAL